MPLTLSQYWEGRASTLADVIRKREEQTADSATAEEQFFNYCRNHIGFLNRYLDTASRSLSSQLATYWNLGFFQTDIARNTTREFKQDARIELLLPFQLNPARFVRVPGRDNRACDWVTYPDLSDSRVTVGRAILCVRWRDIDPMFFVFPGEGYLYFNTIIYTKNQVQWDSGEVIPRLFTEAAPVLQVGLEGFEEAFAIWRNRLAENDELTRLRDASSRLQQASEIWSRVQLPERQKLEILRGAELFETGDPAGPTGLLLSGPSGTGKSLIGRSLSETMGCDFQKLSPADLKDEHLGASGKRVRAIWDRARSHQPAVIFLDECEGILGRRGAAETDTISTDIVQAFLAEWDGIRGHAQVWVIGATNRRDMLDDAILSRFGWEMELALPGAMERRNILLQEVISLGVAAEIPPEAAALTQGMSGRDLKQLARSARAIAYPDEPSRDHFIEAIEAARKSRNIKVDSRATWDTLVVDATVLDTLKLTCTLLRDAERWTAQGVSIPRSLLLIGPPGVGKTQISRTLANESGLSFLAATTADIKANFLGQSGNRVKQLFERARSSAPAILFLDELDVIAPDRSLTSEGDQLTGEIVGQLLQEMDGIQAHDTHVFLMAATNRFDRIDMAIRSRFSEKLVIPLPDRDDRVRLLSVFLNGKKTGFPLKDGAVLLADLSESKNWSGRDLENWVRAAEQKALKTALRNGGPSTFVIELEDFAETLQTQRKSP